MTQRPILAGPPDDDPNPVRDEQELTSVRTPQAHYPLALLSGYSLMPTGSGTGVMAVCRRHDSAASALVVNSLTEGPNFGSLAFMAGEHEAEHHGGPAMPDEGGADVHEADLDLRDPNPTCPDQYHGADGGACSTCGWDPYAITTQEQDGAKS